MGTGCICSKKSGLHDQTFKLTSSNFTKDLSTEEEDKRKLWQVCLRPYDYFKDPLLHFFSQNPGKFKKLLIEGPPNDLRWEIWKALFSYKSEDFPETPINSEFLSLIEKDLNRTYPNHPFFSIPASLDSLRQVLVNFVRLNPELGYCQGMNSVAAVFLITSGNNVKESSIMMHIFIQKYEGKGLFEQGFPKVEELLGVFNKSFQSHLPSLFNYFQEIELDSQLWISKWIMTLFSYSFKLETVQRFWDLIFSFGLNSIVHLSVSILQKLKSQFEAKDLLSILETFKSFRDVDLEFNEIIRNSCRTYSNIIFPVKSLWLESNEESKINLDLENLVPKAKVPKLDLDSKRQMSSLIIQYSPRNSNH